MRDNHCFALFKFQCLSYTQNDVYSLTLRLDFELLSYETQTKIFSGKIIFHVKCTGIPRERHFIAVCRMLMLV